MRAEVERAFQEGGDVARWMEHAGIETTDRLSPARQQALIAASYVARLSALKGKASERDMMEVRNLSAQIGKSSDKNRAILQRMREKLRAKQESRELTGSELRSLARTQGKDEAERFANKKSIDAGGEGGRIEVYAGGAMEWVPNGPGGVPQPTTGDVFYDPIQEEQERVGFARGGIVKGYQEGGSADLGIEEEIVERTTNPGAGQSLTSIILQGKQDALDRLKAGQERISERRVKQEQRAQQDKWFALAQGMLAPTRTGGFGESLGASAGLMQQQSQMAAQQEADIEEQAMESQARQDEIEAQMIDQLLEQQGIAARGAAGSDKDIHGRIQTMVKPEDQRKPIAEQELVFGVALKRPDGNWRMEPLRDDAGNYQIAADRLEPARAAALVEAGERAKAAEQRSQGQIREAFSYKHPLLDIRRANQIFEGAEKLKTSGIQELKTRLGNFLGIDFGDTVVLTELQMIAARDYLSKLESLKGSSSDKDLAEMKGISVTIGKNATANYRQLKKMEMIYSQGVRRGIREAYDTKDMDSVADLWEDASGNVFYPRTPFIKTKAEYDKLPAGTDFYKINGIGRWGSARMHKPEEE